MSPKNENHRNGPAECVKVEACRCETNVNQGDRMKRSKADLLQIPRRELPLRRASDHADADQEVIPFYRQSVDDVLPAQVESRNSTNMTIKERRSN